MHIVEDQWLSERVGYPVFTLEPGGGSDIDVASIERHRRDRPRSMYQTRVSVARTDAADALVRAGLSLVSIMVTLRRRPERTLREGPGIREVMPRDESALLEIAERSFRFTRFHADPKIPGQVANLIKRDWTVASIRGDRGDRTLVAVDEGGRPVGFLVMMSAEHGGRAAHVIDLVAVHPEAQGRGVGERLVRAFMGDAAGLCDEVRVGTQLTNAGAIRLYERLGFELAHAVYDLHLHHDAA